MVDFLSLSSFTQLSRQDEDQAYLGDGVTCLGL